MLDFSDTERRLIQLLEVGSKFHFIFFFRKVWLFQNLVVFLHQL